MDQFRSRPRLVKESDVPNSSTILRTGSDPYDALENGAVSGAGVLATSGYDGLGNRTSLARGNGTSSSYTYDPVSRLASFTHDLSGTAYDVTKTFGYNPASQMTSATTSNDAYASNVPDRGTTGFTTNGLNELATIDGGAVSYDTNGNLTVDPWLNHSFSYNAEDQMIAASQLSATAGLTYDPLGRLDTYNPSSGAFRRFVYDGDEVSAEIDSSGSIVNRYIRGDAPDEVLLHYSGSGSSSYRYYHLDERSSPIAWSDEAGAMAAISHYDEFGIPDPTNPGRFQYTGQMWLSEIGEYFYKTRGFSANMGRFLQADPMGYSVGPNLYEYAGSDPVNFADPLGLQQLRNPDIIVTALRPIDPRPAPPFGGSLTGGAGAAGSGGERGGGREQDIIVTGVRPPKVELDGPPLTFPPSLFVPAGLASGTVAVEKYNPRKNYCGGEGGTALPNYVGGVSINGLCYTHDVCYGGSGTPKQQCDAAFGVAILVRLITFGWPPDVATRFIQSILIGSGSYGLVASFWRELLCSEVNLFCLS